MRTTFSAIEVARRALQAQQRSLDVTGHNVANVNTPGYSRQIALHSTTQPYPAPQLSQNLSNGQIGTGVEISQIVRMRDQFVETRLRQENHNAGYWQSLQDGLEQVELIFNEPSENNIHYALDMFWNSLHDLSINPENEALRAVVLQRAEVMAETINHAYSQLSDLRGNFNNLIDVKVEEVNSLAARIADLNHQIGKVTATGSQPNDLMDKRDMLLQELSQITNLEVVQDGANMITVSVGGMTLVQRDSAFALEVRPVSSSSPDFVAGYAKQEVVWAHTGVKADITGGELAGIMEFRDNEVQMFMDQLNSWTAEFVNAVNLIHTQGYDLENNAGVPLFTLDGGLEDGWAGVDQEPAQRLQVNIQDWRQIAASVRQDEDGVTVEGNGEIIQALAELRNNPPAAVIQRLADQLGADFRWGSVDPNSLPFDDQATINQSFNSIISVLGVRSQKAQTMTENEDVLINHLESLRESVSGVSLDEEMANMIRFQHAYNAAARYMTAIDESLDAIINRMGIVGR